MEALSDDLLADGDLWNALERIMQWGLDGQDGERMEGLQQLLEQLRERRQQELNRYDMSSVFDEIKEKLEEVKQLEREGIQRKLDDARQQAPEAPQATGNRQEASEATGNRQEAREDQDRSQPGEDSEQGSPQHDLMDMLEKMA